MSAATQATITPVQAAMTAAQATTIPTRATITFKPDAKKATQPTSSAA